MNVAPAPASGFVSLVGAGPGDPELLTVRGLRRIQAADAVVHDRLVAAEVLAQCRPDAERYDVGNVPGGHAHRQAEIDALLVRLARAGKRVVRLKGGDPFVFGRGGEEALALVAAGIPFEVVPGVTSALAAPASAGIPVTHRGLARSVTIATGRLGARSGDEEHDWEALAKLGGTLVFLMAVERLEQIVGQLLGYGRPPGEPAAMVRWATTARQETLLAPLGEIVQATRARGLQPPAVLVVGPSVALAATLGRAAGGAPG